MPLNEYNAKKKRETSNEKAKAKDNVKGWEQHNTRMRNCMREDYQRERERERERGQREKVYNKEF